MSRCAPPSRSRNPPPGLSQSVSVTRSRCTSGGGSSELRVCEYRRPRCECAAARALPAPRAHTRPLRMPLAWLALVAQSTSRRACGAQELVARCRPLADPASPVYLQAAPSLGRHRARPREACGRRDLGGPLWYHLLPGLTHRAAASLLALSGMPARTRDRIPPPRSRDEVPPSGEPRRIRCRAVGASDRW